MLDARVAPRGGERHREQRHDQFSEGHSGLAAGSKAFKPLLRLATAKSRTAAARSSAVGSGWFALNNLIAVLPI
jgi:hypothetical protein